MGCRGEHCSSVSMLPLRRKPMQIRRLSCRTASGRPYIHTNTICQIGISLIFNAPFLWTGKSRRVSSAAFAFMKGNGEKD